MPRIAFLFPGQGAQAIGMGRAVCEALPAARELFDDAAVILGYDLLDVCTKGPAERLNATDVSQPALYVASLAALASLKKSDPAAVEACAGTAGLSLGEYTALTFAGALDFADGLRVVQQRGRAMQSASEKTAGGMMSLLGLERHQVESICDEAAQAGTIQIANLLCPGNIAVSGRAEALTTAERLVNEKGGRFIRLAVAGAFHTDLMKPADEQLAVALAEVPLRRPRVPVWSNVDARPHTEPAEIRRLLVRQVLSPVLWEQTVRNLMADGFDKFYEIGPGRVLAGLLKRVQRQVDITNVAA
jgi:[acyl-carrier-protein] S-malonyltransferase